MGFVTAQDYDSSILYKYISLTFFSALYFKCLSVWPTRKPEWSCRMVTLLHGLVASLVGAWLCGLPTFQRCNEQIGPFHSLLMFWSWGYFAFDFSWCMFYWPHNWLMLVHHVLALAAITIYMGKPNSGCIYPCFLAFMEVTSPLLQIRWFLRENGHDKTAIYLIVELTYFVLFIGLRLGLGSYLMFEILNTDQIKFEDKMLPLIFYLVSIGFVYEILGYVVYKYKSKFVSITDSYPKDSVLNYRE